MGNNLLPWPSFFYLSFGFVAFKGWSKTFLMTPNSYPSTIFCLFSLED